MLQSHQLISMIQAERELDLARWQLVHAGRQAEPHDRTSGRLLERLRGFVSRSARASAPVCC